MERGHEKKHERVQVLVEDQPDVIFAEGGLLTDYSSLVELLLYSVVIFEIRVLGEVGDCLAGVSLRTAARSTVGLVPSKNDFAKCVFFTHLQGRININYNRRKRVGGQA